MKQYLLDYTRELFQSWGILENIENISHPEFSLTLFYLSIFGALFTIVSAFLLLFRREKYLLPSLVLSLLSCFLAAYLIEWRGLLGEGGYFYQNPEIKSSNIIQGLGLPIPEKKGLVVPPSIPLESPEGYPPQTGEPLLPQLPPIEKKGEVKLTKPSGVDMVPKEMIEASLPKEGGAPPKADKVKKVVEVTGKDKVETLLQFYQVLFNDLFFLPRGSSGFAELPKKTQTNLISKMKPMVQLEWKEETGGKVSLQGEVDEKSMRSLLQFMGYEFKPAYVSFKLNKNLTPFDPREIEKSLPSLIKSRSCFCLNGSFYTSKDNLRGEIETMRFKIRGGVYQAKVISIYSVAETEEGYSYIFNVDFIQRG
ncbi:MAG: hypothetical protein JSU92_03055 [Deltaproteobacteria bacterium]|nr:MAG: hypothetical protein JSU92_03055 [Deltaproteobacteria bacterium]